MYGGYKDPYGGPRQYGSEPWHHGNFRDDPHRLQRSSADSHTRRTQEDTESESSDGNESNNRKVLDTFAQTTSLQGIPFIYVASKSYWKAMWTFFFIAALGATIYQLYTVVHKYFERETTSKVTVGYSTLQYPAVTICNVNPVRLDYVNLGGPQFEQFIEAVTPDTSLDESYIYEASDEDPTGAPPAGEDPTGAPPDGVDPTQAPPGEETTADPGGKKRRKRDIFDTGGFKNISDYYSYYYDYEYSGDDYYYDDSHYGYGQVSSSALMDEMFTYLYTQIPVETRKKMGHQKETMILDCSFNGRKCDANNFTDEISSTYGNCFAFNADPTTPPLRSRRSGATYGLTLMLYLETDDYIPTTHSEGVRIDVHEYETMAFIDQNGLAMAPGLDSYVGLKMINMTRMGPPYGHCGDDGTFQKKFKKTYTMDGCRNTCLDRRILENCKCHRKIKLEFYSAADISSSRPCDPDKDRKCVQKMERDFQNGKMQCNCNPSCNPVTYEMTISSDSWPRSTLWYEMLDAVCKRDKEACWKLQGTTDIPETLRRNFLKLHIYYRDLNFESIEEQPDYDSSQFLSDLGGTAGLYIGASAMTALEIFHLVLLLCCNCCRGHGHGNCFKKEQKDPQQNNNRQNNGRQRYNKYGDHVVDFGMEPRNHNQYHNNHHMPRHPHY